jgi:hypothetical protein
MRRGARTGALLVALAAAGFVAPAAVAGGPGAQGQESDCFWLGPISFTKRATNPERFDGHFFNFPEESATYWLARFRLGPGQQLALRGRYPHARYESLNSYLEGGSPYSSLADTAIRPDRGSTNPFRPGAPRTGRKRSWTVTVAGGSPPDAALRINELKAPATASFASELVLRVYEPDRGRDLTGGVGLPRPEIVNADGSRVRGLSSVCAAVNDPDRSIERTVQDIPASVWDGLVQTPGPRSDPRTSPAFEPPQWERFFSQLFSAGVFTQAAGNPRPMGGMEETGGFYSNRDTRYVVTHLSRRFGEVLVIRGKMPTFPRTFGGARRMPRAQLRFWSLCSNEGRVTTYAPDCLADRQVPLARGRRFTIVVSTTADRPRNARRRCGVGWLRWPGHGEYPGGRRDYALLILRNMLASPGFEQATQRIERFGDERRVMGPYFPRSAYASTRAFERRGC